MLARVQSSHHNLVRIQALGEEGVHVHHGHVGVAPMHHSLLSAGHVEAGLVAERPWSSTVQVR